MKTTLALLIAALIFLVTPMLAAAEGRHNGRQNHSQGWVKSDPHRHRAEHVRHDYRWEHRYDQRRNYRCKNHLKNKLRKTRHEFHQGKGQIRNNRQRPYYTKPVVVFGVPHLVFHFGW